MRLMVSALLLASVAVAAPALAQDRPDGGWRQDGGGSSYGGSYGGDHQDGASGRRSGNDRDGARQGQAGGAPQYPYRDPGAYRGGNGSNGGNDRADNRVGGDRADNRADNRDGNRNGGWQGQGGGDPRQAYSRQDMGRHVEGRTDNGVNVWRDDNRERGYSGYSGYSGRDDRGWNGQGWNNGRPGGWNGDAGRNAGGYGWNGGRGQQGGWNRGWRDDRRYDWQGWRDSHRDYFRAGRYHPPRGYDGGYRRWGIGVRIDPLFFAREYWIGNPGYYRLPPAYGSYRWIRYYNDALLIDIYSGYVVDELPDFFW